MTTRLGALAVIPASADPFGLANYDQLKANNDYLTVAGADVASATTIDITSDFHGITGTTQIDNITDLLGASEGQFVRLWIKGGPLTIRNNGGGTGNVRTLSGADRVALTNEIIVFDFDGTDWRERRPGPGMVIAYGKKTSSVTTTGTTFAAGADVLASALNFTADGSSDYIVEGRGPAWNISAGNSLRCELNLDGSADGFAQSQDPNTGGSGADMPFCPFAIVAPAAGAHTANLRVYASGAATCIVRGGVGGSATYLPASVVVRRAL